MSEMTEVMINKYPTFGGGVFLSAALEFKSKIGCTLSNDLNPQCKRYGVFINQLHI